MSASHAIPGLSPVFLPTPLSPSRASTSSYYSLCKVCDDPRDSLALCSSQRRVLGDVRQSHEEAEEVRCAVGLKDKEEAHVLRSDIGLNAWARRTQRPHQGRRRGCGRCGGGGCCCQVVLDAFKLVEQQHGQAPVKVLL
jgi:hypothetical protein